MDASREEIEDALAHIVPRVPFPQYVDDAVFLEVQTLLAQHPDKVFSVWGHENPRLFVLLRMLGCDDDALYQKFDSENIGDYWLPLSSATLNQLASFTKISTQDWRRTQFHVLSEPGQMSEQKLISPVHSHRHIRHGDAHFEEMEKIGKGASAEVVRVRHKGSGREFACKRILRSVDVKAQRNQLVEFVAEVGVLKRVSHHHLVSFVASFTDLTTFSLVLNPVAKDVLKSMLERQSRDQPLPCSDLSTLRRAFGCLATALAYLHKEGIRHKDIKPGNILLSDGRVYLCDFGISRDWSQAENSTTEGEVMKFTRRYCAPEVFGRDPRNTKSDVWSLGCVFLEILSVVKGYPLEELHIFLRDSSAGASDQGLWRALDATNAWLVKIRSEKNDSADDIPLSWITTMIRSEREDRITANELVDFILKSSSDLPQSGLYIGSCCARTDSAVSVDAVDNPTLQAPVGNGLRIHNIPSLPHRNSSASSRGRRSITPPSRPRGYRDVSISPHTDYLDPRDSTETTPFQVESTSHPPSADRSKSDRIQHLASRSNSNRTSSLFNPPRPDSEATSPSAYLPRSPVPPPTSFDVKCSCAPQPQERHIFNVPYASTLGSAQFDSLVPTIGTCAKCEMGENKIQLYESRQDGPGNANRSTMPMIWWTTRRLVISYLSGNPIMRHCSSFWLPLADISFSLVDVAVTLKWSDCNQMKQRMSGNYSTHYDWIYDPKSMNNSITIHFNNTKDAQQFIDTVRLPYDDGVTVSNGRRVDVSATSELNIFNVGRRGVRNYRVATLTLWEESLATSKLFIQWPEADIDIRIRESSNDQLSVAPAPGYEMIVEMKNVATPTYHSDTRGEPAADHEKVAHFSTAHQLKTSLAVVFRLGIAHGLPTPPYGATDMLQGLTGWTLCYFAIVTKFKSRNKRFGSKKYGRTDVMLWEKEVYDGASGMKRRGAKVTFRLHEAEFLWVSGTISNVTNISTSTGCDATISVSNKTRGKLLDVSKMIAIPSESANAKGRGHARAASDMHGGSSDLVLTFENEQCG